MDQTAVGKFIAECRKGRNMTQAQLAGLLRVTGKSVSKWENGKCLPDASLYEPLCGILGITIGELFAGQRLGADERERSADAALTQILTHYVWRSGGQDISLQEFAHALGSMAEAAAFLKTFRTREEAIEYLMKGTALSREECSSAYDLYSRWFQQFD